MGSVSCKLHPFFAAGQDGQKSLPPTPQDVNPMILRTSTSMSIVGIIKSTRSRSTTPSSKSHQFQTNCTCIKQFGGAFTSSLTVSWKLYLTMKWGAVEIVRAALPPMLTWVSRLGSFPTMKWGEWRSSEQRYPQCRHVS